MPPLWVRNVRPGDRFHPLGLKGEKKLKDFFIDLKVPLDMRKTTPLVLCADRIAWVCGLRPDDRFKIKKDTRKILRIRWETNEGNILKNTPKSIK